MSDDIGNLCPPIGKAAEIRKIDLRNKRKFKEKRNDGGQKKMPKMRFRMKNVEITKCYEGI